MDNQKYRKPTTSKLKRILQCKSNVSPLPQLEKDLGHTNDKLPQISKSCWQHSTKIHSVASPRRLSFEVVQHATGKTPTNDSEMNQPLSPPPPPSASIHRQRQHQTHSSLANTTTGSTLACATKKLHSSTTRTSSTTVTGTTTPHGRRSSSLHYNNRPLWNQTAATISSALPPSLPPPPPPPPLPSITSKRTPTDSSIATHNKKTTSKTITTCTKKDSNKGRRRHSCSSTTEDQQRNQQSRMLQEAKKTPRAPSTSNKTSPSPYNAVTPSCSVLFSKASPAANAALAATTTCSSSYKQSYRRQCPPPMLSMEKSRSTPLRPVTKVKTYNVSPTTAKSPTTVITPQRSISSSLTSPSTNKRRPKLPAGNTMTTSRRTGKESERVRRQQELEDLISGRRGSTLKLSLTPKNTLLN